MAKPWDKDLWFVMKSLVLALFIMFILKLAAPHIVPPDPKDAEIASFARDLKPLMAREVVDRLRRSDGKPTMLFVYASWCGACRSFMPDVVEVMEEGGLDHVETMFLSIDRKTGNLSRYLVRSGNYTRFTPYVVEPLSSVYLEDVLGVTGSSYNGTIPYIGFFDASGAVVAQSIGGVGTDRLLAMAGRVKR